VSIPAATRSKLSPPILAAAPEAPPFLPALVVELARTPRRVFRTISRLLPPAFVETPLLAPERAIRTTLAFVRQPQLLRSKLRPPTALAAAPVVPPVESELRVSLAKEPPRGYGRFRKAGYGLAGPAIVAIPPLEDQRTLRITTAGGREIVLRRLPTRSRLRKPLVVSPTALPPEDMRTLRVFSTAISAALYRFRLFRSRLAPPIAAGEALARPVLARLAKQPVRAPVTSELRRLPLVGPAQEAVLRVVLADGREVVLRRAPRSLLRKPLDIGDAVIVTGRYDPPQPVGLLTSAPDEADFDPPSPRGQVN